MIRRCGIISVDSSTALICMKMGASGCTCSCSDCSGCTDCTGCPNLTIANLSMVISRAGVRPYTPLLSYPAYSLSGITVCFFIDAMLTGLLPGRYIGKITLTQGTKVLQCGQVEMQVGDKCGVFSPYSVSVFELENDLQPQPPGS